MKRKGEWTKLGKDKLLSSGLTSAQGGALGMYEVVSAALLDKSFEARPALVIPYFDPDKKPLKSHPSWPDFYRVRYLDKGAFGFKEAAGEKDQRYGQPPRTGVCAYMPLTTDWKNIRDDVDYDIIITEGELKAAAASEAGFPTIGLGGVWNFRASKEGVWFLPELETFKWALRTVFICFDSDYLTKPNVCLAINGLCEELQERGAIVRLLALPEGEDEKKVGLDDYLLDHTEDDLKDLLASADLLGMTRPLWKINEEVAYVENPGMLVVEATGQKMNADMFKGHSRWATASATETKVSAKGVLTREKVPAAPVWLRWPLRRTVSRLTYAPGQPKITEDREFNQWPGWGVKPKKGTVQPFKKLIEFLLEDAEPGIIDYFYDWCAYPIQHPGTKMFVAVVIHGVAQGTGKTLVGHTLGRIYGENFKEIEDEDLEESYWAENKQFIQGDEITGKDNRQYMNKLKRLITKPTIDINIKFVPQYSLPNAMNFIFTSNHGDSFFLEDKDRRFLVIEVTADSPLPDEFYAEYDKWYKGDGAAYLMQWLLERKINKDFKPSAPAPRTFAKERMIAATKGDAGAWVAELREFPEQVLNIGEMRHTRDLFSSRELLQMYERAHGGSVGKLTAVGLGRQLSAAGFPQVYKGQPLKGPSGKMERFFAVRNIEVWRKATDRKKMEANLRLEPVREGKK
jgi:hypothetical protein